MKSPKKNIYIGMVGRNNSGKGEVGKYLISHYGFISQPMSDRIKEIAVAKGYHPPFGRKLLIDVAREVKKEQGELAIVTLSINAYRKINKQTYEYFLIDGFRSPGEAHEFVSLNQHDTQVILIAITTGEKSILKDQRVRFTRSMKRGSAKDFTEDTEENFEKFIKLDNDEGPGIEKAMSYAHFTVINKDNDFASTKKQIDEIMKKLL